MRLSRLSSSMSISLSLTAQIAQYVAQRLLRVPLLAMLGLMTDTARALTADELRADLTLEQLKELVGLVEYDDSPTRSR